MPTLSGSETNGSLSELGYLFDFINANLYKATKKINFVICEINLYAYEGMGNGITGKCRFEGAEIVLIMLF